ncbi:MAG: sigma-70 family RNA polymerase sigma factor [Clostridia bacterium]|nr:sigma-70 family RNA polymerase sigma factor [Lachnospiraceae bacterium]NCB99209.1 sigma-70 family RNA polymerase sigma factor [Clostridia bacterium]NCD03381.1 sigma-70 family RNA polymerase sigma factor [Clostridia bacterium]
MADVQKNNYWDKTDERLVQICRQGDKAALDGIMEKYKPLVIKKARSMFIIGGETEDLIQEGMIGLFKAVQEFNPEREVSFYSFAKLCIDRQIYSAITSAGRKKHSPLNGYISLSESEEIEGREQSSPEEELIDREQAAIIREKLDEILSAFELSVLKLFLEGYSYAQIGSLLGKKEKSVDNALRRVKGKLSDIFNALNQG